MKNLRLKRGLVIVTMIIFSMGMNNLSAQNEGEPGPDFEVDLLDGGTFKLSDQLGDVVFIFLFGNTCGPCKAIGPSIEESIYQEYKSNANFTAIGLDVWDHSSDVNSVTGFKNATGITFPLALQAGSVETAYGSIHSRLLVIDQEGILVHKGLVAASNDLNNAIEAINQSLSVVGIGDLVSNDSQLKVFPVPATDVVHFEAEKAIQEIMLYDVAGKQVLEQSYGSGDTPNSRTISLGSLQKGLYVYTIQMEGSRVSGKLLIQR
jgi:peroxiredoxin